MQISESYIGELPAGIFLNGKSLFARYDSNLRNVVWSSHPTAQEREEQGPELEVTSDHGYMELSNHKTGNGDRFSISLTGVTPEQAVYVAHVALLTTQNFRK